MKSTAKKILMSIITLSFLITGVYGDEQADDIIRRVEEKQKAETTRSESTMIVFPDAEDTETYRSFTMLGYSNAEEDSYMEFVSPRSIKGMKILSQGDDTWIYFPSTGRVRKISSSSKGESVSGVGGDFSYEDLGGGEWQDKYAFSILSESNEVWRLEGTAKKSDAVYSKIIVTVGKEDLLVQKVEYFGEEKGHFKDLFLSDVRVMDGKLTPTRMIMKNYEKNSMTVIATQTAEYNGPIDPKFFQPTRFYK